MKEMIEREWKKEVGATARRASVDDATTAAGLGPFSLAPVSFVNRPKSIYGWWTLADR